MNIPKDFPVQPLKDGQVAKDRMTCNTCHLSWDDAIPTQYTPTPSARCPFEYFHDNIEEASPVKRKRSGISGDRALRIQNKMKARIADIYSTAKHFKQTHETILDNMKNKVWDDPELAKAPAYVCGYLFGYLDAIRDQLYHNHLIWVLSCDGKLMTSKEVDALTKVEQDTLYKAFIANRVKNAKKEDGFTYNHITEDEFVRKYLPVDYRSPWSRINSDLSRHVWKDDKTGLPLYDKPFDNRFL